MQNNILHFGCLPYIKDYHSYNKIVDFNTCEASFIACSYSVQDIFLINEQWEDFSLFADSVVCFFSGGEYHYMVCKLRIGT